jgi:hypothetical protein
MALPDPLRSSDGSVIATADQWRAERRPQLAHHFEEWVYGPRPSAPRVLETRTVLQPSVIMDGAATLREIEITTSRPDASFRLLIITPRGISEPVPAFLAANFFGNHRVLDNPGIALRQIPVGADQAPPHPAERGAEAAAWDVARTISAGYGFATFCMSEVVPDDPDLSVPALADFATDGQPTGAISAWAWAFSRSLDALEQIPGIDAGRVIAVGHSRLGKAALWATAMDERIAAVIPSQSGCGGAAPSRTARQLAVIGANGRPTAETVAEITRRFPHWFIPAYAGVADRVDDLPVDQHELVALCVPRPVLLPNAVDDLWADPAGQFAMLRAADPVYRLVAGGGLETYRMPMVGEQSLGRLGYSLRAGGHSMIADDWTIWREFAGRWLHLRAEPAPEDPGAEVGV